MARRNTIANRWFLKSFSVVIIVLALIDAALYAVLRTYYYNTVEQTLRGELNVISTVLTRYYSSTSVNSNAEIRRTVESFDDKDRMELMVINADNEVIITSSGFAPDADYSMPDLHSAQDNESGSGIFTGYQPNGEKVMAVTLLIDIPDDNYNAVRVVTSLSKVDVQLGMTMIFIIAVSCAVLLLMLVLGLYFISSIVRPLRQISTNAQKIARGDFSVRIEPKTDDELGELCGVFNYMAGELQNSESIKNDFISSVSHELRTPLTAIKGWSETVAQSLDDRDTASKGMTIISQETGRLSDMVEELLDFSKIQSGHFSLTKENMDLFAELTDAVIIYSERAKKENKTISYDDPEHVAMIYGDRSRMRQVFINIIDNAVKYSQENGHVQIDTAIDGGDVIVTVEDDGCGIAPADLPKIKSKFYKANNTVRGSGIGLAVADEIVTAHGGTLHVSSEQGKYTRVEIILPLKKTTAKEQNEQ
ncbi:MAG: HAMP domain-containing histidine kinase [Eubacterium sp.]|nr:HAMP domain-containing histidine kinase [Eubacterium sp.]